MRLGSFAGEGAVALSSRGAAILLAILLALWVIWTIPLALGERTLILRDVVTTHLPYKSFGAMALAEGSIPAINPTWNLGQPFRGNPNALAFYPGNLLYLALPFWSAFNLHYALHWLIAFLGMRALARGLGQSPAAALLAACAWAGSGYVLSLLTFYNLIGVGAWAPWMLLGLVRGGRRGLALAGLATGLALLSGEPVSAALLVPAMLLAAWEGRSAKQAVALVAAAGGLGLVVALPQIVATARVLDFTYRAAHGLGLADVGVQALHPGRLLELLLPLPWGWPAELGRFGFWTSSVTPHVPYIYSLHFGVVAATLGIFALPSRRRWALLAGLALVLAWAGGLSGELTSKLTFGLFRYPQKLVLLFALAAALLAGWGLDRALGDFREPREPREPREISRHRFTPLGIAGSALLFLSIGAWFVQARFAEILRTSLANEGNAALARTAAGQWTIGLLFAGLLLLATAWALSRRRSALVVALQMVALAGLAPALVTDETARFRTSPPLASALAEPRTVVVLPILRPEWEPWPPHRLGTAGMIGATHLAWQNVEPAFGVPLGLRYPVAPDLEGMTSPLTVLVLRNLPGSAWPVRLELLRRFGAGWLVRSGTDAVPGLERVVQADHWGAPIGLDRVEQPAPFLRWPARVEGADGPLAAFARLASGAVGAEVAVASRTSQHVAGAEVALVEEHADRIVVDVEGGGGLLVLGRAYLPIYRARTAAGAELATQPVDVALLGVEVPAGQQRVVIDVTSGPEMIASAIAIAAALALLVLHFRRTGA